MGRVRYRVKEINEYSLNRTEPKNYSQGAIIRTGPGVEGEDGDHPPPQSLPLSNPNDYLD